MLSSNYCLANCLWGETLHCDPVFYKLEKSFLASIFYFKSSLKNQLCAQFIQESIPTHTVIARNVNFSSYFNGFKVSFSEISVQFNTLFVSHLMTVI